MGARRAILREPPVATAGQVLELRFTLPCAPPTGTTIWPTPGSESDESRKSSGAGVATATVWYELYQGVPGFGKYVQLNNTCPDTSLSLFNLTSVFRQMSEFQQASCFALERSRIL